MTSEEKLSVASYVICERNVSNEDMKQEIYLAALSYNGVGSEKTQRDSLEKGLNEMVNKWIHQMEIPAGLFNHPFIHPNQSTEDDGDDQDFEDLRIAIAISRSLMGLL